MTSITYYFEELALIKDQYGVLACGYADINGTYNDAEPDVGIMHGWFDWDVEAIRLYSNTQKEGIPLDKAHPFYAMIEEALHRDCDESINEELSERGDSGPDPDAYYENMRDEREYQRKYG